jgi:hypothetical protein
LELRASSDKNICCFNGALWVEMNVNCHTEEVFAQVKHELDLKGSSICVDQNCVEKELMVRGPTGTQECPSKDRQRIGLL